MRIVFMGTPEYALVCLKALAESSHEVIAVVTQPDKPSGRGKHVIHSPVKQFANALGIPIFQPQSVKSADFAAQLADLTADIFVVAAFGQILPKRLLEMPQFGAINVHASLLPRHRGASPIQQAILDGDDTTGITIMQMDKGMDTGDIICMLEIPISLTDTGGSLHDKLCEIAPAVLLGSLSLIENGDAVATPQDNNLATYAPLITKSMVHIDWNNDSHAIVNHIRAYNPFPGAYTKYNGELIKIWCVVVSNLSKATPGEILQSCPKNGIVVSTQSGSILIKELTPTGGKKMTAADYVKGKGAKLAIGDVFV